MKPTADVVIVGGGCMGTSVAWHLTKLGITNVLLLEREAQLGTASTGRNAGGVRHQFSHDANIQLSIESIQLLEKFEAVVGHPADLHQDGYLFLLNSDASVETFRKNVELQRRHGLEVDWLDAKDAASLAPGLNVDGVIAATFCGRDGIADPNGVTMGFAKAAQAAGATIERNTEVIGISTECGRVTGVVTNHGTVAAPVVVNAAGPYSRAVGRMAGVDVPVDPYRRHIFIAQAAANVPSTRMMVIDFESTFYFHREGAGVLFGMGDRDEAPTFDTTVQWDFLPKVVDVAVRRLPALDDASISHAWAGLYEVTSDANPLIGPAPGAEGFFLITGFSGHGFQHSPAAGRILADLIAHRDPRFDLSPFAPDRFARGSAPGERNVV
jgi:sarcosine oxidase, subunit beta